MQELLCRRFALSVRTMDSGQCLHNRVTENKKLCEGYCNDMVLL